MPVITGEHFRNFSLFISFICRLIMFIIGRGVLSYHAVKDMAR